MPDSPPRTVTGLDYRGSTSGVDWSEIRPAERVAVRDALCDFAIQPGVPAPHGEIDLRRQLSGEYQAIPVDVLSLEDAWVETTMCVAITARHEYVVNTLRSIRQAEEHGYEKVGPQEFTLPKSDQIVEHDGQALLVGLPAGGNYFHWTMEAVARWLLGSRHIDNDAKLIVPKLNQMELSALQAAGATPDRLLTVPPAAFLRVANLIVPPRGLRGSDQIQPAATRELRALAPSRDNSGSSRIFISRESARRRRIQNESEVIDVVGRHGFETVRPDAMTVAQQIDLFADADAILGFHGAGLTNAVFAPEGSTLIELQQPELDKARVVLYWNQAAASGQNYVQLISPEAPGQSGPRSERDILVDPRHLDAVLGRRRASPI